MRPRCSATTSHCSEGVGMDARSVWFRETGEGRPKEQLLIETMFCVYYLSKGSAVRVACALRLEPPFLNTSSLSVPSCGSRTVTGWTSTACQQTGPSTQVSVPPAMFDPHAIRHFSGNYAEARRKFLDAAAGQGASIESWVLETHRAGGRAGFPRDGARRPYACALSLIHI